LKKIEIKKLFFSFILHFLHFILDPRSFSCPSTQGLILLLLLLLL